MRGHPIFAAVYDLMTRAVERGAWTSLARWQDRLERQWGWVAGGCPPNRDTVGVLKTAGLDTEPLARDRIPKTAPIVRPLVRGTVRRLASD